MPTKKTKKFTDTKYFQVYPSDPIPLRLYGTVKPHKLELSHKDYYVNHMIIELFGKQLLLSLHRNHQKLKILLMKVIEVFLMKKKVLSNIYHIFF